MIRIIPYVLDEVSTPPEIVKSNRIQFWIWLILITVVAFCLNVCLYFSTIESAINDYQGEKAEVFYDIFFLLQCVL